MTEPNTNTQRAPPRTGSSRIRSRMPRYPVRDSSQSVKRITRARCAGWARSTERLLTRGRHPKSAVDDANLGTVGRGSFAATVPLDRRVAHAFVIRLRAVNGGGKLVHVAG